MENNFKEITGEEVKGLEEHQFIPDYEVLDEEERKDLVDYFEKINGFPKTYMI